MNNASSLIRTSRVCQWLIMVSFMISSGLVDASPKIEFIAMASPDIIEVVVCAGKVHVGRQVPYVKQAGDVIQEIGHNRTLIRNGKRVGVLVGADSDVLRPYDTFSGDPLDTAWADSKASYWIMLYHACGSQVAAKPAASGLPAHRTIAARGTHCVWSH